VAPSEPLTEASLVISLKRGRRTDVRARRLRQQIKPARLQRGGAHRASRDDIGDGSSFETMPTDCPASSSHARYHVNNRAAQRAAQ